MNATVGDFEAGLDLTGSPGPHLVALLGSTLGNYDYNQRLDLYRRFRAALGPEDVLLLGVDLVKDPEVILRAYDDVRGVTAAFNLNVLQVLNRELGSNFVPEHFHHVAWWDEKKGRVEMRLRSLVEQTATIPDLDLSLDFVVGQDIRTEISTKFSPEPLAEELATARFGISHSWTDAGGKCALLMATPG